MTTTDSTPVTAPAATGRTRLWRIVAVVTGIVGAVLAIAMPLLPVKQTTAELNWPQNDAVGNVTAPLASFVPIDMNLTVPCALAARLPREGGVLVSTMPSKGQSASARGLFVRATADAITVTDRDLVLLSADRRAAQSNPDCRIEFSADGTRTTAKFAGITSTGTADDDDPRTEFTLDDQQMRPQIVGVYTALPASTPRDGLSLHATVDTRYVTSPNALNFVAIVLGVLLTLVSLVALHMLDKQDGRRHRRFLPAGWFTIRPPDLVVGAILAFWWIAGANTSDDGYNFVVGRITADAGYADNYFRYFGVPQDPFGWHFQVISWMSQISVAGPWMRLPAFALGLLGWWLISREVIPRLGRTVRHSSPAVWSAAFVFLAMWLPYNNGLRPEPAEAVGALLTWCCVERAIATRRLLPYAVGVLTAAFTLALAPGGLMAVAALLAGIRPIVKTIVVRLDPRERWLSVAAMLAPVLAAGTAVLFQIFADQPLGVLLEGNKVATDVGPTMEWWQEPVRYYWLDLPTADGTLARRFGVLAMILCLVVVLLRLLRREHPNGIARAPIWRLVAVTLGTMFLISFTPTKWTHHFGVYAGIAGALAAVAGAMMSPAILRSRRNRTFFASAVLVITGISFAGPNGYWFVGSYGVPWWDRAPRLAGVDLYWFILAAAIACALAGLWFHFRDDFVDERTRTRGGDHWYSKLKFSPLPVISLLMVLFMVASLAKGAYGQRESWSWAKSNLSAFQGNPCALADDVMVEADPNAAMLSPAAVDGKPAPAPAAALSGRSTGFTPNGIPSSVMIDATEEDAPEESTDEGVGAGDSGGTDSSSGTTDSESGESPDTSSGNTTTMTPTTATTGNAPGINGSTARLPFGLDPARTPVLGNAATPGTSSLTTGWYRLPARSGDRPLLTLAVAGFVAATDPVGAAVPGRQVVAEFGRIGKDGAVVPIARLAPLDVIDPPTWRNLRFPLADAPPRATVVRIVVDEKAAPGQWVALTPPRVPKLATLNEVVGGTDPVFIDWVVGLVFPCQRPMRVQNGILEVPKWRIMPDAEATKKNSQTWMSGKSGGPLGISTGMLTPTLVPTYLRNDWGRDWGGLQRFTEIVPAKPAELHLGTARRSGLWNPAPMRSVGY